MDVEMMEVAEATMSLAVTINLPRFFFFSGKAQDVRGRNPGS